MTVAALILDTHVWLWFAEGDERVRSAHRELIREAGRGGEAHVSIISVWEIATQSVRRRIELSMPRDEWVENALTALGIRLAPLTVEIALASAQLPGPIHSDPMDRFIAATARSLGATLVTRDRRLLAYGRLGYIDVLEA